MKRRTKRFDNGGDVNEEFKRPIKSTADAKSETAAAPKKTSFSAAFAAARRAGDKTFEWEGKKYGTAMKGETGTSTSKPQTSSVIDAGTAAGRASEGRTIPEFKRQGEFPAAAAANRLTRLTGVATEEGRAGKAKAYEDARRQAAVDRAAMAKQTRAGRATDADTVLLGEMGQYKKGGKVKKMAGGGMTSSASKRADGCAMRGKTRGKMY